MNTNLSNVYIIIIVPFCENGGEIEATRNYFNQFSLFRTFKKVQDVNHSILS